MPQNKLKMKVEALTRVVQQLIKELTERELEAQKDDEPKEKKLDLNVE